MVRSHGASHAPLVTKRKTADGRVSQAFSPRFAAVVKVVTLRRDRVACDNRTSSTPGDKTPASAAISARLVSSGFGGRGFLGCDEKHADATADNSSSGTQPAGHVLPCYFS